MFDLKVRGMGFDEARNALLHTNHDVKPLENQPYLHIWQHIDESREFFKRVREYFEGRPIINILEIGGHVGGHAALLSTLIKYIGLVVVIEPEIHNVFHRKVVQSVIEPVKLIHIPLYSEDPFCIFMVQDLIKPYGRFDVIVADGDHSEPAIRSDFENYFPMLSTPGVFMVHDISHVMAGPIFDKMTNGLKTEKIQLYKEQLEKEGNKVAVNGVGMIFK